MARIIVDPSKAAPPLPPGGAARRPTPAGSRFLRILWPALCLLQLGLICGYFAHRWYAPAPSAPPAEPEPVDPLKLAGLKPGEAPSMERGDELAREGRYDLALAVYKPAADAAPAPLRPAFLYRMGLCLEGLGRPEGALKTYQELAAQHGEGPAVLAPTELGQARVFLRKGKVNEAKGLLCPLLLRSGQPALKDKPYLTDAHYLLALALAVEASPGEPPGPLSDGLATYTAADWHVDAAFDWMPIPRESAKPKEGDSGTPGATPAKEERDFVAVVQPGPSAEASTLRASLPPGPLTAVVQRLAGAAQLKEPTWTDTARRAAADRNAEARFENLTLADALLALTEPLGLVAQLDGNQLRIVSEGELPDKERNALRAARAARLLNRAVAAHPEHPLAAAARMELAGLDARAGRWEDAAGKYEALYRDLRRSPVQLEASYNLGVLRMRQGRLAEARAAFYRVIDRNKSHELAGLAYLQIGRCHLQESDADHAVTPLRRALATTQAPAARPAAAAALAVAYLLTNNPRLASAVLVDNRDLLAQEPYRPAAEFLHAYARYLTAPSGRPSSHDAGEVLASLWALSEDRLPSEDRVLGPAGALLVGRAYRDLGQTNEMVIVYRKLLPTLKGPLAEEMAYAVAEEYLARDRRDSAAQLYAVLARGEGSKLAGTAKLRLAEIALQEKKPTDALALCRKLIDEKQPVNRTALLSLMGQAYEMAGDHRRAARCFAGEVPEEK